MSARSVLISGMGIAGPALAHWLLGYGFSTMLVERAPRPRTGGYIVDFWGAGYDITEQMGLLPEVLRAGYRVREVRLVGPDGRRIGGFDAEIFREAANGSFTSLARGDLSAILCGAIEGRAEMLFGDSIAALEQDGDGALVHFERESPRRFDLVIGADGLHSRVRSLAFGSERDFEKFLGYRVAAFEVPGYRPRDENVYVSYGVPGLQAARFAMRDDRTLILLVVADDDAHSLAPHDPDAHKSYWHARLRGAGWECPQILAAMDRSEDVYFDRVSQICADRWWKGRVGLVGDAAFAPSLLAGQGAALAIIGAYVLAGELARAAHPEEAFARYEKLLHPFMARKQSAAKGFARSFAPKTRLGVFLRNQMTKALAVRPIAKYALGSTFLDRLDLPDYAARNQ